MKLLILLACLVVTLIGCGDASDTEEIVVDDSCIAYVSTYEDNGTMMRVAKIESDEDGYSSSFGFNYNRLFECNSVSVGLFKDIQSWIKSEHGDSCKQVDIVLVNETGIIASSYDDSRCGNIEWRLNDYGNYASGYVTSLQGSTYYVIISASYSIDADVRRDVIDSVRIDIDDCFYERVVGSSGKKYVAISIKEIK